MSIFWRNQPFRSKLELEDDPYHYIVQPCGYVLSEDTMLQPFNLL